MTYTEKNMPEKERSVLDELSILKEKTQQTIKPMSKEQRQTQKEAVL